MFILFLIILIVAVLTIFFVQNAAPVAVSFLYWRFDASMAIMVFLSVLSGIIVTVLLYLWIGLKKSLKKDKQSKVREV